MGISQEASDDMMRPISLEELNKNIKELDASKAEGLDGVTNDMLSHAGPLARQFLVQMFNNVIVGGKPPDSWKDGGCSPCPEEATSNRSK